MNKSDQRAIEIAAAFEVAPELEKFKRFQFINLLRAFPTLNASQALGLLAGAAIFVMAMIGLVVIGSGIMSAKEIVDKLANPEYARGVITYILAIGTVAVILVLLVSALLRRLHLQRLPLLMPLPKVNR